MSINVAWIEEQAVNANALKNGRAIYQSGKFNKIIFVQQMRLLYGRMYLEVEVKIISLRLIFRINLIQSFVVIVLVDNFLVNIALDYCLLLKIKQISRFVKFLKIL